MRRLDSWPAPYWRRLDSWLEQYWRQHPKYEKLITPLYGKQASFKQALSALLEDGIDLAPIFEDFIIPTLQETTEATLQSELKPLKRQRESIRKKAVDVAAFLHAVRTVRPCSQIPFPFGKARAYFIESLHRFSPRPDVYPGQMPLRLTITQALLVMDGIVRGLETGPGTWMIPEPVLGNGGQGGRPSQTAANILQVRLENEFEARTGNRHMEQAGIIVSAIFDVARDSQASAQKQSSRLRKKGVHDQLRQEANALGSSPRRIKIRPPHP